MDNIKDITSKIIDIIKDDDEFEAKFKKNPAKAIEDVIGVDLPDDKVNAVVKAVRVKLDMDAFDLDDLLDKDNVPGVSNIGKLLD